MIHTLEVFEEYFWKVHDFWLACLSNIERNHDSYPGSLWKICLNSTRFSASMSLIIGQQVLEKYSGIGTIFYRNSLKIRSKIHDPYPGSPWKNIFLSRIFLARMTLKTCQKIHYFWVENPRKNPGFMEY